MHRIHLDWNATTPLRLEARAAMQAAFELGNPSAVYAEGRKARGAVERARLQVAAAVGARPQDVIFTSGGTEANGLALTPSLNNSGQTYDRLLVSAIEHPSVRAGGLYPPAQVTEIAVTRSGLLDLDHLQALLAAAGPALVSVMLANNETGVIQPIAKIAELVHGAGGVLHVDAIQAFGKIAFSIGELQADWLTLSAHKIGGPKGVGALVLAPGRHPPGPLLRGGGQEQGRRAGTENVIGIVGFGAAAETAIASRVSDMERVGTLRDQLERALRQIPGTEVIADQQPRLPNTTLVACPGLKAETTVIGFDLAGIAVSAGSACSSGKVEASHVLQAMKLEPELARSAIRISLGWETRADDIDRCAEVWRKLAGTLATVRHENYPEARNRA